MLVREGMSLTQRKVSHLCDLCVENKRSVSGASDESEFPKILCVPLPLCGSALIIRGRVLSLSRREGRTTETRGFSKTLRASNPPLAPSFAPQALVRGCV